jgi:glycosyltransferase involved in cell wall biosynthesis
MRILVNDYAGHPFQLQLSRSLARDGHTVLHTYFGAYQTPKGRTDVDAEMADRLKIEAVTIPGTFKQHSALSRRKADHAYGVALCRRVEEFQPNIVISANTPLDAQKQLLKATHRNGGRFVFWLQDVLSVAIEFVLRKKGIPFAGIAGRIYSRLERSLLQQSDAIVCIAPEFLDRLRKWGIDDRKVSVIENWSPLDEILPQDRDTAWAAEQSLGNKLRLIYSGTLGMKHRPELLLELARDLQGREDVAIVVVAQGAGADWLKKQDCPAILRILPFQPYERHAEVLASADVLITLLDEDCGAFAVPSKTLAYMCAGRASLVAASPDNLTSRIIGRAGAGVATAPTVPAFLAGAKRLLGDPELRTTSGARARAYASSTFAIESIRDHFLAAFESALQHPATIHPQNARAASPTVIADSLRQS